MKPKLVDAILNSPHPTCKDDVKSFLEMVEFYAKFVKGFSGKVYNIGQLLKNHVKFNWSCEFEMEFEDVKNAIVQAPILSSFDCECTNVVTVDASSKGLGGVLTQIDASGKEAIVAFASRALSLNEENFSNVNMFARFCI
ncbi:hypothetical protein NDU88_009853 [Pleurodeles waltl]|uniref:Reverse transcriptase/retrotransposon-derived protein RNase H-like domain-containing protein n=1 Tax=Pleurodeles waltl TaxID=8319 RepID=A0AAV7PT93_PLEWA|nr:hypothetical protein NDU88_009853 [Pleurodeles waltl]